MHQHKINEPPLDRGGDQLDGHRLANPQVGQWSREPTFCRRLKDADPNAVLPQARHQTTETLAHMGMQQQGGLRFANLAFHFLGGIFLRCAVRRQIGQFGMGVSGLGVVQDRLDQPLGM